jgi:signal transduction histidine kinase
MVPRLKLSFSHPANFGWIMRLSKRAAVVDMASFHDNIKHAMRTRFRSRWPVFELLMLATVAVIGWAAWQSWEVMREFEDGRRVDHKRQRVDQLARQRMDLARMLELYSVRDDYLGFEKHVQPSIQEMRTALRRYVQSNDNKDWKTFEWSRRAVQSWTDRVDQRARSRNLKELDAWVKKRSVGATNSADAPMLDVAQLLQRFRDSYTEYIASANFIDQTINSAPLRQPALTVPRRLDTSPRDPDAVRRREVLEERMEIAEAQSLQLLELIDHAHRQSTALQWFVELQAVTQPLAAVDPAEAMQEFHGRFMPVLYTLSAGLVGLCIFSGVAVYRRFVVAPLHLKLVERETIMEQQKKFAHFEKLTAVLAHEIKQPLSAINVWVWTLQKNLVEGTAEYKGAGIIRSELNRVDQIVKDFLKLTQPVDPKLVAMTSEPLLREMVELLRPKLERNSIKLRVDDIVDARFQGDPQQLKQVLLNLIQNAAESINENGDIILRSRRDRILLRGEETDVVLIEVQDNGPGIPADVQERLFDPFFSTKESGTGLGLAIAARIIDKHDGALVFETGQGRGTTFGVVLPVERK